jgi:hypothetical protein
MSVVNGERERDSEKERDECRVATGVDSFTTALVKDTVGIN